MPESGGSLSRAASDPTSGTDRDAPSGHILYIFYIGDEMSAHPGSVVMSLFTALILVLSLTVTPLHAQDSAENGATGKAWLTGGLGTGTEGIAAVASVDLSWDRHIVSIRSATTQPFLGSGDRYWDAGVLYGRAVRWPEGLAALSAGLGVMGGEGTDERPSLPVAARVSWHPTSAFGLGAYAFVNVNPEDAFGGLALTLEFGVLR